MSDESTFWSNSFGVSELIIIKITKILRENKNNDKNLFFVILKIINNKITTKIGIKIINE